MFEDLNRHLGWTLGGHPTDEVVLVKSEATDCGFVLHHFISLYVKESQPVCIVTLAQAFSHYAQACGKLGANLDKAKLDGKLAHVDAMAAFLDFYLTNEKGQNLFYNSDEDNPLKNFFLHILKTINGLRENTNLSALLVVDDISMLLGLGFSLRHVEDLLHYLHVTCKNMNILLVTSIPVTTHAECNTLLAAISHIADTVIGIRPLQSGYSKEVHGHLDITKRDNASSSQWQYRLTEKNLILFAKGMSSAVL